MDLTDVLADGDLERALFGNFNVAGDGTSFSIGQFDPSSARDGRPV